MTENTWRRGQKHSYTERPLYDYERAWAEEHHDVLYKYMAIRHLDMSEWYDILVIPYLNACKKWFENEDCRRLAFSTVAFKKLDTAVMNYYRAMYTKKRMPKGGFISLDYVLSSEDGDFNSSIEEAITISSRKHYIETECIDKMEMLDILKCLTLQQRLIFKGLLSGYSHFEIMDKIGIQYMSDYEPLLETVENIVRKTIVAYA